MTDREQPVGWESERKALTDLRAAREIPREQFPGHKEIYCSNLEGFLGGRFPALLAERDRLLAENERLREALDAIVDDLSVPHRPAPWAVNALRTAQAALASDEIPAPEEGTDAA